MRKIRALFCMHFYEISERKTRGRFIGTYSPLGLAKINRPGVSEIKVHKSTTRNQRRDNSDNIFLLRCFVSHPRTFSITEDDPADWFSTQIYNRNNVSRCTTFFPLFDVSRPRKNWVAKKFLEYERVFTPKKLYKQNSSDRIFSLFFRTWKIVDRVYFSDNFLVCKRFGL